MNDLENLKRVAFLGTVADCSVIDEVYQTRKQKSQLVQNMIDCINRLHTWLGDKKNRDALLAVPMYWLSQTHEDPEIGSTFKVDSTTGKRVGKKVTSKKRK